MSRRQLVCFMQSQATQIGKLVRRGNIKSWGKGRFMRQVNSFRPCPTDQEMADEA